MAAPNFINRYDPGGHLLDAPANFVEYAVPAGSIRSVVEGRNRDAANPREERDVRNKASYRGYTFQRVPDDARTQHIPAAELAFNRLDPEVRIPMRWWATFLPNAVTDRRLPNGQRINHDPGNKTGPHLVQLEREHITAPTFTRITDSSGQERQVTANAKPQLLYPRINTLDRPANEKHCSYAKVRDPSTNSWRCVRNPNHHKDNLS
jgi:hypothetical protein